MDVAIMIEGQDGLTWPRWQKMAAAVEELGFAGLYRSDHFTNNTPPDEDSLELWPAGHAGVRSKSGAHSTHGHGRG
jgi:alkanesulfonate monooxygenase SsuD/methylene tetrahydromethanopterin reductase-like flavin-dependent oxidoreductase (luciferase family)